MAVSINEQVVVKKKHLRGNLSEIKRGMVVSTSADKVTVQFPGEFSTEVFPADQVKSAKGSFGYGSNVDNPFEKPVVQMFRR